MSRQRTSSANGQFPSLDSPSPTHKRRTNHHNENRTASTASHRHRPSSVSSTAPSQKSPAGGRPHYRAFSSCTPRGQQQERLERSLSNVGDASVTSKPPQHQTRCSPERHHHAPKILSSHHHTGCFAPSAKHAVSKAPSPALSANRNRAASRRGIVRVASADLSDPDPHGTAPGRKGVQSSWNMSSKLPGSGRKPTAATTSSPARSVSEPHDVSAGLGSRDSTPPSSPLEDQPVESKTLRKLSPRYNIRLMLTNYTKPADDSAGTEVCDKESSPLTTVTSNPFDKSVTDTPDDKSEAVTEVVVAPPAEGGERTLIGSHASLKQVTTEDQNLESELIEGHSVEEIPRASQKPMGQDDLKTVDSDDSAVKEKDEAEKAVATSPDGRFLKFDEEVGRGSFKTIYKGLDTLTGVSVAWCELQERLNKSERQRFREEAEMLKGLQHPNIVRFYEFWEMDNAKKGKYLVLITELMSSGSLKSYLKRFKKINTKVIKSWCRQILKGLNFLHSRQPSIIHRDLKCDNIFITGTCGAVKIGDLGLATLKNRSFAKSVIGTPEFMAPEVFDEQYTESVDIYAFGMCVLEMATLEYPYSECTGPAQIYKKVTNGILPQSFKKVEQPELKEIIGICISSMKEDRPTVKDLLQFEFFQEDMGLKVEFVNKEEAIKTTSNKVELLLRLIDPKKRKEKHKENEAIQFEFDVESDNSDEVAQAMAKNNIILDEDIRSVALLVKNQISYLTREKARYQNKIAQQQTNFRPTSQQSVSQVKNISIQNQPIQIQVAVPQSFHSVPTQQQLEQINSQMLHQEMYQQQPQVYPQTVPPDYHQIHMNQQVNPQTAQFTSKGFDGADYQAEKLQVPLLEEGVPPSQTPTIQPNPQQMLSQMQSHGQNLQSVVSHGVHNQNIFPTALTQIQPQKIPPNQVNQYFQYEYNLCVESQNQSTQVSPPCYNFSPVEKVLTEDTAVLSPEQFQNESQQQGTHHCNLQLISGSLPTTGSETYQVNIQQKILQNLASTATVPPPPPQQTSSAITNQVYPQDGQIAVHSQSQTSMPLYQSQSPKKVPQPIPPSSHLPNVQTGNTLTGNQCAMYSQQSVFRETHPQSPQKVLSPSLQNPPSSFLISEDVQTPHAFGTDPLNQVNILNPLQFQQVESTALQKQSIEDNFVHSTLSGASYPPCPQTLQDSQGSTPQQRQPSTGQQTHFSPVDYSTKFDQEAFDRVCHHQMKREEDSTYWGQTEPSVASELVVERETYCAPSHTMSSSTTSEGFSSDAVPDFFPASQLPVASSILNNVAPKPTNELIAQKYIFIPDIPQPIVPNIENENQGMPPKQMSSVPVPQGQHGGQLQYEDPNLLNAGSSSKPLVGFSTSFSHVTTGPDKSHILSHDQNYPHPHSYTSQNYPSVWNARSTSPLPRDSSMSTCFLPPVSNNLFCRGSSFQNLRNDGSQSPVVFVLQSVGNFSNSQPCVLNPILCSPDTPPVTNNNFNDIDTNFNRSFPVSSGTSQGNSSVKGRSAGVSLAESFPGNIGKYIKYVTPVSSRTTSPVQIFSNKFENESPLSTPPPQIISSPPALATHVLHPESRIGYPILFSPKTSPPPTPLRMRSRSATPLSNLSPDYGSQTCFLNPVPQNINIHSNKLNTSNVSQVINTQCPSYRARSNTFGGTGGMASVPNQVISPQTGNTRQRLSPLPSSVIHQLSVAGSSNDPYRNSYTIVPFDRSRYSPIHLSDNGPFVSSSSSSRLFMSLAVENTRKLNSPQESTTLGPLFRRNYSTLDDFQCMHSNPPMQHNAAVHKPQKILDNSLYLQGSSHPASVMAPDSSCEIPIGLRTVSSCYNAANTSQVDPVKDSQETIASNVPRVDSSGSLPVSEDAKSFISAAEAGADAEHSSESSKKAEKKKIKRRRTQDRTPKLTVICVEDAMVECQLESTKGKTVTFKFDYTDTCPEEIANKLVITNLLADNHADIFTEFIQEVINQLKENPNKIPVIQFLESSAGPACSPPPTLRRQTFKDHLDLEKNLSIDSQDSSLPSTPQDQEKEYSPKKQSSPSRHVKPSAQNDVPVSLAPAPSVLKTVTVSSVNTFAENQAVQSTTDVKVNEFYEKTDSSPPVMTAHTNTLLKMPVIQPQTPSTVVTSQVSVTSPDIPYAPQVHSTPSMQSKLADCIKYDETMPASHGIHDQAKRIQDFSSSSSSGGSTQHSLQQRPLVPDLSSLQLKLAQLTSTGCSMASDAGERFINVSTSLSNVPGALQTSTQNFVLPTCSVSSMTSKSGGDSEENLEREVIPGVLPSSDSQIISNAAIVTPVPVCPVPVITSQSSVKAALLPSENVSARRHTVATNIEGLKLELQKIHTPSVPSVNLKSNIQQGLQAIFSLSSQTVTTPAHSNAYNHSHQLLSSSTPSLSTPTEVCASVVRSPIMQPISTVSAFTSIGHEENSTPDLPITSAFSRFKVTPVIEDNSIEISVIPETSTSQSVVNSEQNQTHCCVKKQGRFQITRVADEISLNAVSLEESKKNENPDPQISLDSSISISSAMSPVQQTIVPANISQNILLQHSCSNPALVSSVPEKLTLSSQIPATALTRSVSDITFANGQPVQNFETDVSEKLNLNLHRDFSVSEKRQEVFRHDGSRDATSNVERNIMREKETANTSGVSHMSIGTQIGVGEEVSVFHQDNPMQQFVTSCSSVTHRPQIIEASMIPGIPSSLKESNPSYPSTVYSSDSGRSVLSHSVPEVDTYLEARRKIIATLEKEPQTRKHDGSGDATSNLELKTASVISHLSIGTKFGVGEGIGVFSQDNPILQQYMIPGVPYSLKESNPSSPPTSTVYSSDSACSVSSHLVPGVSTNTEEARLSQYLAPYPTLKVSDAAKASTISSTYIAPVSESEFLAFTRVPQATVQQFQCSSDRSLQAPEGTSIYAHPEQMIQTQEVLMKDANANPLHSGYSLDDGKNIQSSLAEEENKNFEVLECNDEYLKVILERQEEERQELYRRHQQELLSYKMHHLRAHYDGKCCFHSKSVQSAVASSQTGNIPFTSYANTYLHSKEQQVSESSVSHSVFQNMHKTQGGSNVSNSQNKSCKHEYEQPRPSEEYLSIASSSMTMPTDLGSLVQVCEPTVMERVSDPQNVKDQLIHHACKNELEIPYLIPDHAVSAPSNVGISSSSLSTFTVPPMQIQDVHCNKNMAALSKKTAVDISIEGAPHSSPQTVRRIINATSALNVNPAFHQVTPQIVSAVPMPQQIPVISASNGYSPTLSVSLPYSQSSDVVVSSPSKLYFSQSGS